MIMVLQTLWATIDMGYVDAGASMVFADIESLLRDVSVPCAVRPCADITSHYR